MIAFRSDVGVRVASVCDLAVYENECCDAGGTRTTSFCAKRHSCRVSPHLDQLEPTFKPGVSAVLVMQAMRVAIPPPSPAKFRAFGSGEAGSINRKARRREEECMDTSGDGLSRIELQIHRSLLLVMVGLRKVTFHSCPYCKRTHYHHLSPERLELYPS